MEDSVFPSILSNFTLIIYFSAITYSVTLERPIITNSNNCLHIVEKATFMKYPVLLTLHAGSHSLHVDPMAARLKVQ